MLEVTLEYETAMVHAHECTILTGLKISLSC